MTARTQLLMDRAEAASSGGMVAAKTVHAAEVGAAVLRQGGNAVDAAVATAFAAGVAEPWMSGVGGGGLMVVHRPGEETGRVVEFPMVAPAGATAGMFPLSGAGADAAMFGWPGVVDAANIVGHRAVAVPGVVAGLSLALERFGSIGFAAALAPAIRLAEEGVPVTWHTTYAVGRDVRNLSRFPATAAVFCPEGIPPATVDQGNPARLRQPDLARTLQTLAAEGPGAFYQGPIADAIAGHLSQNGAPFAVEDLARYGARVVPALATPYRDHQIFTPGGGTGGTTLAQSLRLLGHLDVAALGHNTVEALHLVAQAFRQAFADRFAYLADPEFVDVPLDALLSPGYAAERAARLSPDRAGPTRAGDPARLGVAHGLAVSMPEYTGQTAQAASGSTTHLGVIDRDGMAVSLTQTLLSLWGSRVVVPGTGILLNNGMMWFDPEPGRPNSVEGGKRPLSNMAPALVVRDGRTVASIGASGGRKIINCQAQLATNLLDHGLGIQAAITAPRIDASTGHLLVSARLPEATQRALSALGHAVVTRDETLGGGDFASPAGVLRAADGRLTGGADPFYFPAGAVGVEER